MPAPDDVIQETDVRYWMLETQEPHDIESFLVDDPNNIHLWMKLAYKKLSASNGFVKFPTWKKIIKDIFTARIRRMTEGYIFSLSTLWGGGGPRSR